MHKAIVRVCLFLFAIDSALKSYTHQHIAPLEGSSFFYPYGGIAVFRNFFGVDFSLNYAKNTGAAWGAFGGFQKLLVCVRIAIVIGLFSNEKDFSCKTMGAIFDRNRGYW
jgi:signal peptidase II